MVAAHFAVHPPAAFIHDAYPDQEPCPAVRSFLHGIDFRRSLSRRCASSVAEKTHFVVSKVRVPLVPNDGDLQRLLKMYSYVVECIRLL